MSDDAPYGRILLKLSGEALMGQQDFGHDAQIMRRIAGDIQTVHAQGIEIGLVIGGGNIFRGASGASQGIERASADFMGMLATVINAIALQNVRLFDDLLMLNTQLTKTNEALNEANRQLQELDKLKSDFIGVITHEMRTPFANIMFSLEILERHGRQHLPPELLDQFDQVDSGIKSAKMMVDNLVTFASFLSKQVISVSEPFGTGTRNPDPPNLPSR